MTLSPQPDLATRIVQSPAQRDFLADFMTAMRQGTPPPGGLAKAFCQSLSRSGFSPDYSTAIAQISVLNILLGAECSFLAALEGRHAGPVRAVGGFLVGNREVCAESFSRIDFESCAFPVLEYYLRHLVEIDEGLDQLDALVAWRGKLPLTFGTIGAWLLPASLAASRGRIDLANRLMKGPFENFIRPNFGTLYGIPPEGAGNSDRFSYQTDDQQLGVFLKYQFEMGRYRFHHQNDSLSINCLCLDLVERVLRQGGVDTLFNFGSSYGWLEYQVAKSFPGVRVIGYDESPVSADRNREALPLLGNLSFADGPLLPALDDAASEAMMLVHCRTGTLIDEEALAGLYRTFASRNVKLIAVAEHIRFSPKTGTYPDFDGAGFESYSKTRSELTRIHDYRKLLGGAGYQPVDRVVRPELSFRDNNPLALGELVYAELFEYAATG